MTNSYFLEEVTDENFNEEAYLAANSDVAASGIPARFHFDKAGRFEGRKQITFGPNSEYWSRKYARFRSILQSPYDEDPRGAFPIVTGASHHDLGTYASESANSTNGIFEQEVINNTGNLYLDLGCGLRERVSDNCLYVEVYNARCADLIVDPGCPYPIRDGSLDGIGCFAVLEHTRQPWFVVQEMQRMLKPGGKVFIDWPFLQPVHGYPSHYFNATREGLASIFSDTGFVVNSCETLPHQTAAHTVHWILSVMVRRLPEGKIRAEFERMSVRDLVALDQNGAKWRRFVDALDESALEELACGNFLVATKVAV